MREVKMKMMILSSVIQGSFGLDRGLLVVMGLGLTVLVLVAPVFGGFGIRSSDIRSSDICSSGVGSSGVGGSGVGGSGVGGSGVSDSGVVLFLNLALRKVFKTACIRDSENKPLPAISIISIATGIDKIFLAIFGVAVKILELEYPNGRVFPKLIVDFYAHQNTVSDTKRTRLLHAHSILNYT